MQLKMTIEEISAFLSEQFPQIEGRFEVLKLSPGHLSLAMQAGHAQLRPGGTVSGPAMFELADCAMYVATLSLIGPQALAVTTNASINFMRKPDPGRLVAEARVLKLGRVLCVGDVLIHSEGQAAPVAQASLTYSIPPSK